TASRTSLDSALLARICHPLSSEATRLSLLIDIFLCRTDNYGYLVHDVETKKTAAIDAPDAKAIQAALERRGWQLSDVFITHHHTDHVEGIPALKREFGV